VSIPESFHARGFRIALTSLRIHRKLLSNPQIPRHAAIQMCRAATSVGANLEEAKSAYSRRDLAAKYAIALREARECLFWLALIKADQPMSAPLVAELMDECDQMVAVLTKTVRSLRTNSD
jgi:four helix bundle protein